MKSVKDISELDGVRVLLRSSLNVPIKDGSLRNRFRLERALPTLRYLHEQNAKVVLIAHVGRNPNETLKPIFKELERHFPLHWGGKLASEGFRQRREIMQAGDILMAENIRQDSREFTNDPTLISLLKEQGDVYVNDAFEVVHREHASVYGIAQVLPAYAGLTLKNEVLELSKARVPNSPSLFLLGGSKFETKLPLVQKYLELYDRVFIGGALANDIFKARGLEVGRSLVSDINLNSLDFINHPRLMLPIDVVVDGPEGRLTKQPNRVTKDERILDFGMQTVAMLATYIDSVATILWNGPFGAYEQGYREGTELIARHVAVATGRTIVGGGDTVAAIENLHLNEFFDHVSIGGGSMLAFLEHGTTPALELLN